MYEAVLKTKIKFGNIDWVEGCKYIAITSTEQECRLGPLKRVLPRRRCVTGTALVSQAEVHKVPEPANLVRRKYLKISFLVENFDQNPRIENTDTFLS